MNHLVTISSPKSEEKLGHLVYRSRNWQISLRQQLIEPQEKLNPIVFVHISCHLFDIFCQLLVRVTAVRRAPQKRSKCCQPADSYGRCVKKCFTMVGCGWKDDVTMFPCPASSKWPFSSPNIRSLIPWKGHSETPQKGVPSRDFSATIGSLQSSSVGWSSFRSMVNVALQVKLKVGAPTCCRVVTPLVGVKKKTVIHGHMASYYSRWSSENYYHKRHPNYIKRDQFSFCPRWLLLPTRKSCHRMSCLLHL